MAYGRQCYPARLSAADSAVRIQNLEADFPALQAGCERLHRRIEFAGTAETDLDLGHYERFIDESLTRASNVTAGQVYAEVIARERRGDFLGGTIQVIPHVTDAIKGAIRAAAQDAGADGFMLLPPMRYASDRRETLAYLNDVAAVAERPIMVYNNPIAYGIDITPEDFVRLADNPKFEAIKESAADTRRFTDIRRLTGDRFALFCGVDDLALECFALGADGWVAGLVVAFPRETVRLWELCEAGRWDEARALYAWFLPLLHLDIGSKFVQQIKLVEALVGVGSAKVRAPRMQLAEAEASRVERILEEALATRPALD